ncbi:hypothetical protein GCM10027048_25130 [Hymenobacter coalescens]
MLAARGTLGTVTRPGRAVSYRWDDQLNAWEAAPKRTAYTYDAQGRLSTATETDSLTGANQLRELHAYTGQGQPQEIIYQQWNGGAWENAEREVLLYDARGRDQGFEQYSWQNNAWVLRGGSRAIHTYNAAGGLTQTVYEKYSAGLGAYEPESREIYTLDAAGQWTSLLSQDWDNGAYADSYRLQNLTWHNFAQLQPAGYEYQAWNAASGIWDEDARQTFAYQTNGSLVALGEILVGPNTWVNAERYSETYDNYGNYLGSSLELWAGAQWITALADRHLLTYDASHNVLRDVAQDYDDTSGTYYNSKRVNYGSFVTLAARRSAGLAAAAALYPNPTLGAATFTLTGLREQPAVKAELVNALGQVVHTLTLRPRQGAIRQPLDLGALPAGLYRLRLHAAEGLVVTPIVKL